MFNEESEENAEKFAVGAKTEMLFSSGVFFLVIINLAISIFFNLLIWVLPISIMAAIWYPSQYIKKFKFRFDKEYFFVRKGVVTYGYTLVPYENIQDVHVVQHILGSILGVWTVSIFTATVSNRGVETIPGLSKESAEKLKNGLFEKMRGAKHVSD